MVPTFQGHDLLIKTLRTLDSTLQRLHETFEIIVVLDGPHLPTLELLSNQVNHITGLRFYTTARRRGLWAVTTKGINLAKGKYVITYDDDGEYPPHAILQLVHHYHNSTNELIFGVCKNVGEGSLLSRQTIQDAIAGQKPTSSLRIFRKDLVKPPIPEWMYIDAYFNWILTPQKIGHATVAYHRVTSRMSLRQKSFLFFHALVCYRRPLRSIIALCLLSTLTFSTILKHDAAELIGYLVVSTLTVICILHYVNIRRIICRQNTN